MKWQHNPKTLGFGLFAFKQKNTATPVLIHLSIDTGIPTDYKGWWLGPLEIATEDGANKVACICINCQCWVRVGTSPHGKCHRLPPVDNNWSATQETGHCFEFIPKENLDEYKRKQTNANN